jgi:hypothetical protein
VPPEVTGHPPTVTLPPVYAGDPYAVAIRLEDDAGVPLDLSGIVWTGHVKYGPLDGDPLAEFTVTPNDDGFVLSLDGETSATLRGYGTCRYDVEGVDAGDVRRTWIRGTVPVTDDVTRG